MLVVFSLAYADTVYLKNGRHITGLIKVEDDSGVELEVSGGSIRFGRSEINRIERSGPEDTSVILRKMKSDKKQSEDRQKKLRLDAEQRPRGVEFIDDSKGMLVKVILNDAIGATLVLDTGASTVMLKKSVAEKLGIKLDGSLIDAKLTLADGREIKAKQVILKTVKVQDYVASNVAAVIPIEDSNVLIEYDGLLGMSFLKNFNFKIDHDQNKLILERR